MPLPTHTVSAKQSALCTRAEHHRNQLQLIPALLWGHCGSKAGARRRGAAQAPVSYTRLSVCLTCALGQQLWLLQHRGCTEQPAPGHGAPSARRAQGSAPAPYCPAEGRVRHGAHLAAMPHSRKSRVATLRQSSTPWLRSHFSTVTSVAGEGRTRSRSCSSVRYLPAGTRGQRAARSAAGPGRQVQSLPYCGERGSDTARTRRARRSVPRCRSARVSCTPCSGLTRPARTHPGGGLRADRERGGQRGRRRAIPQRTERHLPERLVPLQRPTRGTTAPGGRTQRQHGGERE